MKQTITDYFLSLVTIDSESKNESDIALKIKKDLEELGAKVQFDQSGELTGSNTGNLFAYIEGDKSFEPVLLSAHLDTVVPGNNVKPVVKDGVVYSDGTTILGADDKSGLAQIVWGIKSLLEAGKNHPPIEILFTTCEEIGLTGSQKADYSLLKSKRALVFDTHGVGTIMLGAPSQNNLFITVKGKKAHAGTSPQKGLNAIVIASNAITKLSLGRIDEETTANIGIIKGGEATNIIPDDVFIKGEVRSHSEEKLSRITEQICDAFKNTVDKYEIDGYKAAVDIKVVKNYSSFYVDESNKLVEIVKAASTALGMSPDTYKGGGGSDANFFSARGIESIVLGTGMNDVHTTEENISITSLEQGARWVELILEMLADK